MYKIISKDGRAKHAEFSTVHGTVQTPVFMNVATAAAIKGAVSSVDLKEIMKLDYNIFELVFLLSGGIYVDKSYRSLLQRRTISSVSL